MCGGDEGKENGEHDVGKLESPNSQVCAWLTELDFFPVLGRLFILN